MFAVEEELKDESRPVLYGRRGCPFLLCFRVWRKSTHTSAAYLRAAMPRKALAVATDCNQSRRASPRAVAFKPSPICLEARRKQISLFLQIPIGE